jgi:hypothetical protein
MSAGAAGQSLHSWVHHPGSRKEGVTPPIGTDGSPGQTQVDAPHDDTGGAEDEESSTE